MTDLWLELARRVTASEREYREHAEKLWRDGEVIAAVRVRGIADGLVMARDLHLAVVAEGRRADEVIAVEPS